MILFTSSAIPPHQSLSALLPHQSSSAIPPYQSLSALPPHQSSSALPPHQSVSAFPPSLSYVLKEKIYTCYYIRLEINLELFFTTSTNKFDVQALEYYICLIVH